MCLFEQLQWMNGSGWSVLSLHDCNRSTHSANKYLYKHNYPAMYYELHEKPPEQLLENGIKEFSQRNEKLTRFKYQAHAHTN